MEENRLRSARFTNDCKLCDKSTCFCQTEKKENLIIIQSLDGTIIITEEFVTDLLSKKLFEENKCMPFRNPIHSELRTKSKWLQNTCKDSLVLRKLKAMDNSSTSVLSDTLLLQLYRIYQCKDSAEEVKLIYNEQYFPIMKIFYSMFLKQFNLRPTHRNNMVLRCQGDTNTVEQDFKLKTINSKAIITSQDINKYKMLNLFQCYFSLLDDKHHLENFNSQLLQKIKDLEMKVHDMSVENAELKICKLCPRLQEDLYKLREEYNVTLKNYSSAQIEKERMVMKYATGEKRLLEVQKSVQQLEKKYQEVLKENAGLQKRLQKAHDNLTKLNSEMNSKCSEMIQLRSQIEHQKDNDSAKEMKLKWTQNRLKFITDAHTDAQTKLNESLAKITKLTTECEVLRSQQNDIIKKVQKSEESKVTVLDQQLKEQQARLILERHMAVDSESSRAKLQKDFDTLANRQRIADKENHLLISQISTLQNECTEYKSKLTALSSSLEKEKEEVQNLRQQLTQMETLNKQLESNVQRIGIVETELKRLSDEKLEFQSDIESYRQREVQMLEFTQKLTDKNVQIQSELNNLQTKYHMLENNQQPLLKSIDKFTVEIKKLEHNLSSEKTKRTQECEILAKYMAELTFYNQKLLQQLEDLEGQNVILRKKYELTTREMNRELHLYHAKLKDNNFRNTAHPNGSVPSEETHDNSFEQIDKRNKMYDALLEKEKLFDQIIKLQKINVKRAEKLDFLEGHSHALLEELQKKTKIIQNYREMYNNTIPEKK